MKKNLPLVLVLFFLFYSTASFSQIVLNEISSANGSTIAGPQGNFDDWIELYNPGSTPVDLTGYGLSDNAGEPYKFRFDSGMIAPGGFALVFADDYNFPVNINHWEMAVNAFSQWRYFTGNSQPDTNWRNPSFNDHVWPLGNGGIGYGDGDDNTVIPSCFSVMMRIHFNVSNTSDILKAAFLMDYDDGFVAYLNGVEITRANLGSKGSRPLFDQYADDLHEAQVYQGLEIDSFNVNTELLRQILVTGDNVLAVEVHNDTITSTDLSSIPYLFFGMKGSSLTYSAIPSWFHHPSIEPYEAPFKLNGSGEDVFLTDNSGNMIDQEYFTQMSPDNSIGHKPDGSSAWCTFNTPSPGFSNNASTCFSGYCAAPVFSVSAGFYTSSFTLNCQTAQPGGIIRYTTDGGEPTSSSAIWSGSAYRFNK